MSGRTICRAETPEALHAMIEDGFNRRDMDAVMAAYEDDAMLVTAPGGVLARGRDAIRAATEQVLLLHPQMKLVGVKKVQGDGTAVTHGRWWIAVTLPDGEHGEMTGRGTLVSRRRRDGTWGIVLDDLGVARSPGAVQATSAAGQRRRTTRPIRVKGSASRLRALT